MDDEYNVISSGIQDGEEELQYPDDDGETGLAVVGGEENRENAVLNELEQSTFSRRKRRIEDIEEVYDQFGNFSHPVDWHMRMPIYGDGLEDVKQQSAAKRRALEELEQKINAAILGDGLENELNCEGDFEPGTVGDTFDEEIRRRYNRRAEIMRTPPTDGSPWIGISDSAIGHRFYVRLFRDEKKCAQPLIETITKHLGRSNVGYKSFQAIVKDADELRIRKLERKREERAAEFEEMLGESLEDVERDNALWVNKYEARNFADLLSDDNVNRNILTWFKLWDECVFRKKTADDILNSLNEKDRAVFQMDGAKMRRPHFKMLLISGPAGLGKTTLAKVVARQAGYSVIDVNASDARTVADMSRVMEGAVKTARTLDADQRPACLVLDEIDGTPIDTIRHLIRCLQAGGRKAIRRPIIGICNNLFVPALRELRGVAWCVQIGATKCENLTRRLQQICDRENLRCDASTLRRLSEMCANDMRHAINTLQWVAVAARKRENRVIGMRLVQEVIEKDRTGGAASIFEHWASILELSRHVDSKGIVKSVAERVYAIERIAANHGGEDRFVGGLHANYLVQLPIGQIRKASTWFQFYDDIQQIICSVQNWSVQKYAFVFFVSLHLNIATHARVQIQYPQAEQNVHQRCRESEETIQSVRASGSRSGARKDLVLDILPYLLTIVQPPIKPMNEQLYSQRDLSMLNSAISVMCDYGLTYTATMIKEQVNWLFSPSIDILVMFPLGEDERRRQQLANATRQLIAHKITLMKVNLGEGDGVRSGIRTNTEKIMEIVDRERMNKKEKRLSTGALRRMKTQQLSDVVLIYQEGDSCAIKKNVTMNQLCSIFFGES